MATKTKTAKQKAADERLEALHEQLVAKTATLVTSEGWAEYLNFVSRFRQYSFNNTMLILIQKPDATRVASYKKWLEMGRQVRKGEKGLQIFAPMVRKREDAKSGEEKTFVMGFRLVSVFDVSQTDGDALPDDVSRPVLLEGEAPANLWESLALIVAEHGYRLQRGPSVRGENGYTSPADKVVQVTEGLSPAQSCKTLAHEIAHMLLHCGDDAITREAAEHRGVSEVEAESIAHLVASEYGIVSDEYSVPYVAGWSDGKPEVIAATADSVLKTTKTILAKVEEFVPVAI